MLKSYDNLISNNMIKTLSLLLRLHNPRVAAIEGINLNTEKNR